MINKALLVYTVKALLRDNKGLLAMDESNDTCNKRFAKLSIPQNLDSRRDWRELIVGTEGLNNFISGAILYDETIRQKKKDGTLIIDSLMKEGIIPGIKVDTGAKNLAAHPGEKITEGLDGLRERLMEYAGMGARFAKWRAVIDIDKGIPSTSCLEANANALARFAALCQEANMVPIVEPEVLMDGDHDLEQSYSVTEKVLRMVFNQLYQQRIFLQGILLKPSMVMPGLNHAEKSSIDEIAEKTIQCFLESVPASVGGIVFLSGGQSPELASSHLNAMHIKYKSSLPWPLSFSFARAIQQPAMNIWKGKEANIRMAQQALLYRAKCNHEAVSGQYQEELKLS